MLNKAKRKVARRRLANYVCSLKGSSSTGRLRDSLGRDSDVDRSDVGDFNAAFMFCFPRACFMKGVSAFCGHRIVFVAFFDFLMALFYHLIAVWMPVH
uniref:Uncharacterized protein n=1 Tax=Parascaris equorum TaxID=6256 RepID=A0A914RY79_PAREQ